MQTFVLDYHLWAEDLGPVVLRMMLEAIFYMRFLSEQNRSELFLEFQKYGIGQMKLYKMHLRKLVEEGTIANSTICTSLLIPIPMRRFPTYSLTFD